MIVLVVAVHFLADNAPFVETAGRADDVRQFNGVAVRASGDFRHGGFPVGAAVALLGMADSFLRNWHWYFTSLKERENLNPYRG